MVNLALIPSLSGPVFRDINFPENGPCAHQPRDLLLADEAPT